jgi:cobalamin biosynthesis Mg chelatase CobN
VCGCAHRYTRAVHDRGKEEETARWQTAATAQSNERKTETASSNRKVTGRTVVKKPDGTVIDTTWVDEAVAKYTAQADASALSASTAAGDVQRSKEHDKGAKTGSSASWWPPLWMWLAGAAAVVGVLWFLRWRARRLRLL